MSQKTTRKGQKKGQETERLRVAEFWIRAGAERFEETGNPVYAWEAIAECLVAGVAFPPLVSRYLLDVARDIARLSRDRIPQSGKIDRAVAGAARLRGGPKRNPFTDMQRVSHELMVAFDVYTAQTKARHYAWDAIFEEVAQEHRRSCEGCKGKMSAGKVKALWYKHALSVIPPHLIDKAASKKLSDILR